MDPTKVKIRIGTGQIRALEQAVQPGPNEKGVTSLARDIRRDGHPIHEAFVYGKSRAAAFVIDHCRKSGYKYIRYSNYLIPVSATDSDDEVSDEDLKELIHEEDELNV